MTRLALQHGIRVFTLAATDGLTRAEIVPDLGGIVASLVLPGPDGAPRECLFRHPWFWDRATPETRGGIPLLFPACGRLLQDGTPGLYRVQDRPFHLPIHGFAMRRPWEVVDSSRPDELRLRLADTEATRAVYPFPFILELHFATAPGALTCRLAVRNSGREPMPYAAGFHPYFATSPPGGGKEQTVYDAHPRAGLLYTDTKTAVAGTTDPPAFPQAVDGGQLDSLLLGMGADRETRLAFPDGFEIRQTASTLFPFRQLYTLPGEPFFCDEPWMSPAGALNRPGAARLLPPGESESGEIRIAGRHP